MRRGYLSGVLPGVVGAATLLAGPVLAQDPTPIDFATQIRPIFEATCIRCHGPDKQKGHLRLDHRSFVFAEGDEKDWVIKPGDPKAGKLLYRISLPPDDFDIMPAEGDVLEPEQIELIRAWIVQGADWPEGEPVADSHKPTLEQIELPALTEAQVAARAKAMIAIAERGGLALPVAANTTGVYVNLSLLGSDVTDEDLALLRGLEPSLVWLNLGRTGVTDAGLAELGRYPELRRLHLDRTALTDAGVHHLIRLERLSYLNLFSTQIGDDGALALGDLKELRRLFLWQTQVSAMAADRLRTDHPELYVDLGDYALAAPVEPEPDPDADLQAQLAMTCCGKAHLDGSTCEHACCIAAFAGSELCVKCNPDATDEFRKIILDSIKVEEGDG